MAGNAPQPAASLQSPVSSEKPLCVDLDGTLVRTDTLLESMLALLARNPFSVFQLAAWLCQGKAYFKARVAERIIPDPACLPYRQELIEFLREERSRGRRLALATASNEQVAHQVAAHLNLFDEVLASSATVNLAGARKLAAMEARYGKRGFVYAGNARVDVPIWCGADQAILVNTPGPVQKTLAQRQVKIARVFADTERPAWALLRAMRPSQWSKNLLVFIPLLFGHKLREVPRLEGAALAFAAFCLAASAVYLVNDLLDLGFDRRHHLKKNRSFAAGTSPLWAGFIAAPLLAVASLTVARLVSLDFMLYTVGYFAASLAYAFVLKRLPMIDVLILAGLYTLRVMAGGSATDVVISPWLLGFSMFIFLSLALVKRYSELQALAGEDKAAGRGYTTADLPQLNAFGTSSSYIAVLVLALYINSADVRVLYSRPLLLWAICPLLIYWTSRVWLLAHRGQFHEDPVQFALTDKVSYLIAVLVAAIMLAAL